MEMELDYKKYSLEQLKDWVNDALSPAGASPQEIYDAIYSAVEENYSIYKDHMSCCYDLMVLLKGNETDPNGNQVQKTEPLQCDKDDTSEECKNSWVSFWEEQYYPEEVKDDGMRPWGHSDMEALKYSGWQTVSESKFNEMFPNREKFKNEISRNDLIRLDYKDGYIYESPDGGRTVYARKPGQTERTLIKEEKVKKWILPVQQSNIDGTEDYYVNFPDDLLEAANLKEGDQIEWIPQNNGSYLLKKVNTITHHSV